MLVYLVRHGQSEANAAQMHGGWADTPLTELGKQQAAATAKLLEGIEFDVGFCSDLQRARQTAAIALPGMEFTYTPQIREISVGNLEWKLYADMEKQLGESYLRNRAEADYSPYGGESRQDLLRRCGDFLEMLRREQPGQRVAVVCHAGAIKCMTQYVLGVDVPLDRLVMGNAAVTILSLKNDHWQLLSWNYTDSNYSDSI